MIRKLDFWDNKLKRKEESLQLTKTQLRSSNTFWLRKWGFFKIKILEIPISKTTLKIWKTNWMPKERRVWWTKQQSGNFKMNWREKWTKLTKSNSNSMKLLRKLNWPKIKSTSWKMNLRMKEESQQLIRIKLKNTNKSWTQKKIS